MGNILPYTDEKIKDMETAIGDRSPLATAFLEDEAVRLAAEKKARAFVLKREEEDDRTPLWHWCVLYFLLGMLFSFSVPAIGTLIWEFILDGKAL